MASFRTPLFRFLNPVLSRARHVPSKDNGAARAFSTTIPQTAKSKGGPAKDPRIALIRYHLQHPKTPRPLKLSRMRLLRHWTIHRAWMLFKRTKKETEQMELWRMYQAQHAACEELRNLDSPGTKDAGRLYRVAMLKKGVFGSKDKAGDEGVPIEYARWQVDTPGKEPWNHTWKR